MHSHSKSCRKYKNEKCRYHFGKFFTDQTILALPLPEDLPENQRNAILNERERTLSIVKQYIDSNLDPKKRNILSPCKESFEDAPSIENILSELGITKEEYYNALSISCDSDFQIHIRCKPNACFINNFFIEGLKAWKANIDIQPVFNHYKTVTYMCAYFSKSEDETSEAMKQAAKEALNGKKSDYDKMKSIAKAYITKRECSVQEAVYFVMTELWLRKIFPCVIFFNSNLPERRYRIFKKEDEIGELPDDSTDIFQRNMLDRYLDRPNKFFKGGLYEIVDRLCFAEFLSSYYVDARLSKLLESDSQPVVLDDKVMDANHDESIYPKVIPLMSSNEKLKCRKVRAVLRYHQPSPHKSIEQYAHHLLFAFYPFRKEEELKSSTTSTYFAKLQEPFVTSIVNENKKLMEPYGDMVEKALLNLHCEVVTPDPFGQQENDDLQDELNNENNLLEDDESISDGPILTSDTSDLPMYTSPTLIPDNELNAMIRSLNHRQRALYNIVHS